MSGSDSTAFTFGTACGDAGSSGSSGSGSSVEVEVEAVSQTSACNTTAELTEGGYLDDTRASGSRRLDATSLFATLAQRQLDQQQMSQVQYDDASAWSTRPRNRASRRRTNDDLSSTTSSAGRRRSASEYSYTSSDDSLQREWDEQLAQLKLMLHILLLPFVGKFFGRKFGYFLYNRYQVLGSPLRRAFWSGLGATA
ncbi:conserved hypothetical protein [Sporisorium reilianum SRZ2]|uniref:Uncharacterized protein n=1 Tax=Sporisorium reilianum (strain SRZ2) TaxID=999809 RepID=E6ZJS5_SPORE|nr:conserved hypothetical protein [Sporisorium reilianum SRZ2]